ncbi:MAG: hypothetical protein L3J87_05545 [Thermoplasmata archaeon]|nr:hypothetical protein [Thermoplasmata archaeon]
MAILVLAGVAALGVGGLLGAHAALMVGAPHANSAHVANSKVHAAAAAVRPLQPPSPPVTATVTITAQPPASSNVPESFNYSVAVTGANLTAANLTVTVAAWQVSPSNLVANFSVPVVDGQSAYTATVDYGALTSSLYNGGDLPGGNYQYNVWATVSNSSNTSVAPATGNATTAVSLLSVLNVRVGLANTLSLYETVPFNITFNVTVSGNGAVPIHYDASSAALTTTTLSVEARYIVSGCGSVLGFGGPCPSVSNVSVTPINGTGSYTVTIDDAFLLAGGFGGASSASALPAQDPYQVIAWATLQNTTTPTAEPRTGAAAHNQYLILHPLTGSVLSPAANSTISTGNVSISVGYGGDYITGANVTVTSATGTLVFSNSVAQGGTGFRAATTAVPWVVTAPGTYTITLTVTTIPGGASGTLSVKETVTVVPAGGIVYQNSSSYVNQSVIPGLSGAAGGALLIVIGLIVGMIVALALGRMMWGGAKPAPAQPWTGTGNPNECPVCHQTFPSEEAMKEHSKSAHGMS